jgi:PAS domain S-box-containing protein
MGTPLRVLLAEDSVNDEKLLVWRLRNGGYDPRVTRVETREAMLDALQSSEFDIVISDYRMPEFTGLEALGVLHEAGLDLPFIIVSGTIGESNAVAAMKAGAHDYVMKDNLLRLVPAIGRELEEASMRKQRREGEQALRESEQRFRTMADSAPVLLWMTGPDGQYTYVNKPWLEFTGRTIDQEIGTGCRDIVHPDDLASCLAAYDGAFGTHEPFQAEYRLLHRDAEWRWVLDTGTPRFNPDGTFAGYIGTCVDVTERKNSEIEREALRKDREELLSQTAAAALQQRGFLRDILYSVTEGKLHLCNTPEDLPTTLPHSTDPIPVSSDELRRIRHTTLEMAETCTMPDDRTMDLVTSVGEASMNAVVHAGGGIARIYAGTDKVQVWIEDKGRGIDLNNLPRATLERGFTTGGSLGHGFFMMLNFCDSLYLLTGPEGTTVVIEQNNTPPTPAWLADNREIPHAGGLEAAIMSAENFELPEAHAGG